MRIVHIVSGAGGMYCGSCLHAAGLVSAISQAGHDVVLLPAYTPIRTDGEDLSVDRVVFGGLNVYLQHRGRWFRHMPRWVDRLLDAPSLVRWLARFSSTRPEKLGPLTVAMLRGHDGQLRREHEKLLQWLEDEARPDVVHLSNIMLLGMARPIAARFNVPVVCSLTGEDAFLDQLPDPYRAQAWSALRVGCQDLDALVALNGYYAGRMADCLGLPRDRIDVIEPGLDPRHVSARDDAPSISDRDGGTIGFLSRVSREKGLHVLVEGLPRLAAEPSSRHVRMKVAGYLAPTDRQYLRALERQIARRNLTERFTYIGEPDLAGKMAFLNSVDLLCLPTLLPESKALPVLEAWAAARPVVLPDHGAFTELVQSTGGGLLYPPNDSEAMLECLRRLIHEPDLARRLGRQGYDAAVTRFSAERMARENLALYSRLLDRRRAARHTA